MVFGLPTSAAFGNLLEMQILRHHSRPAASETLDMEPVDLCFNKPFRNSDAHSSLRTTGLELSKTLESIKHD